MSATTDTFMPCPGKECSYSQWVSPEDEDASFSALWGHVESRHANYDRAQTSRMMACVTVVDASGNEVHA